MTRRGPYRPAANGTIRDLVHRYQSSPRVRAWAKSTAADKSRFLAAFAEANGDMPVRDVRRSHILALRDELSDRPGLARNWLNTIRGLFAYAVDLEYVQINVARDVALLPPAHREGFRTWREDEVTAYLDHHPPGSMPHLALTLMLYTAAARADAVRLGPQHVTEGRIRFRRQKTGGEVDIPVLGPLSEALALAPLRLTFLISSHHRPFDPNGLLTAIQRWAGEAGLAEKDRLGRTLGTHGLRKCFAVRMAAADCSTIEIADWLGITPATAQVYIRARDRAKSTDRVAGKLGVVETNVVRIRRAE
jgi:integrase